ALAVCAADRDEVGKPSLARVTVRSASGPGTTKCPTAAGYCGCGGLRVAVAEGVDGRPPCPRSRLPELAPDLHRRPDVPRTGLRTGAPARQARRRHTDGLGQRT